MDITVADVAELLEIAGWLGSPPALPPAKKISGQKRWHELVLYASCC